MLSVIPKCGYWGALPLASATDYGRHHSSVGLGILGLTKCKSKLPFTCILCQPWKINTPLVQNINLVQEQGLWNSSMCIFKCKQKSSVYQHKMQTNRKELVLPEGQRGMGSVICAALSAVSLCSCLLPLPALLVSQELTGNYPVHRAAPPSPPSCNMSVHSSGRSWEKLCPMGSLLLSPKGW